MRRVAHLIYGLKAGGAERLLVHLTRLGDKERFYPIVIALYYGGIIGEELQSNGVRVITIRSDARFGLGDLRTLIRLLRENSIDIVHTHLLLADFWGGIAAWWLKLPQVSHFQRGYEGPYRFAYLKRWFSYLFPSVIICVSEHVQRFLVRYYAIPRSRTRVIYNGVSISTVKKDADRAGIKKGFGLAGDDLVILNVSRLEPEKGHSYLLQAFEGIAREVPNARLVLAGDGGLRKALDSYVADHHLTGKVIFLGEQRDISSVYAMADLFVLASILSEGLPLVVPEAMAYALPVIATDVGGTREVVKDGQHAILVEPKNANAIGRGIRYFLAHREECKRMGVQANVFVRENFAQELLVKKVESVYDGLFSSAGKI